MSRNGAGTYSLPAGNPVVTGTTISSTWANTTLSDMGTALTASIANDGQTPILANLPMSGYKHTGVAVAAALTDYARTDQVQNSAFQWLSSIAGADTITANATPTPSAYAAGQTFRFVSAGANTGATTLNVSSLGAKSITKNGTTALSASEIPSGAVVEVTYDGTQFQLVGTSVNNSANLGGVAAASYARLNAAQVFSGGQGASTNSLTDGVTVTPDFSANNPQIVQLGGNRTLGVPTGLVVGKNQSGTITVLQDKTGSRTLSYAWPYVWANGTAGTLSTPGCSEDQLVYEVRAYNSATVTITIATPGVVTMTAHGFYHGQRIQITTTGALPTGLTASTTYFVEVIDANSFYLCTSLANVAAGTRIATSGTQSGVHTLTGCTIRLALNKAFA